MAVNVGGLIAVIVFYLGILVVGMFASWKKRSMHQTSENLMVAGRDLSLLFGCFTITATWVGGGFICGTVQYVADPNWGLIWTQAPFGFAVSLILGAIFYAGPMREAGYVTMLDPIAEKFGKVMGALLYIPAFLGEMFWSAAILSALGTTLAVILDINFSLAVIISTIVAVSYTLIGGLYSVAFTDIIQLVCILGGLLLGLGFAFNHEAVGDIIDTAMPLEYGGWLGTLGTGSIGMFFDDYFLIFFGGIPWQVYFQRVLSSKDTKTAKQLSVVGAFGCLIMALPPIFLGAVARSTNWTNTEYKNVVDDYLHPDDYIMALPLVLQYLTPYWVAVIGLGAVSAAVMSSADSSVLANSSMFASNIYKPLRNVISRYMGVKEAADIEIIWVMRIAIFGCGTFAAIAGIIVKNITGLLYLCGDVVYVLLFSQLTLAVHMKRANTYGSSIAFVITFLLRLLSGVSVLKIPAVIEFPWFADGFQYFPFKTLIMLIGFILNITISLFTDYVFKNSMIDIKYDIFKCFSDDEVEDLTVKESFPETNEAEQKNPRITKM